MIDAYFSLWHDETTGESVEISNHDRTHKYIRCFGGMQAGNPLHNECLWPAFDESGPYLSPAADPAPWYDPNIPESEGFGGFIATSISGFGATYRDRDVFDAIGGGGSVGPLRLGAREIVVNGWLVGAGGDLYLEYGLEWLTRSLLGEGCDVDPCAMSVGKFFAGRPNVACCVDTDLKGLDPERWARLVRGLRMGSAPQVVNRWASDGCYRMYEVRFSLIASSPLIYGPKTDVATVTAGDTGPWTVVLPCCEDPQDELVFAEQYRPRCFASPINEPVDTSVNCWCQPTAVFRSCVNVPASVDGRPQIPIVTITSGPAQGDGTRNDNVRVVFYESKPGDPPCPCGDLSDTNLEWWECNRKVGVWEIPQLPASSTFTADGRDTTFELELANGETFTSGIVQGESGVPFGFPSVSHCNDLCVVLETDCDAQLPGTELEVCVASSYLTGGI